MVTTVRTSGDKVIIPDVHAPFHDKRAMKTVMEFVRYMKPKDVIILGDWWDCAQISRFDKDPKWWLTLQEDIDEGVVLLSELRSCAPKAEFHMIEGNHERRLTKWLWQHPEIAGIRSLQPRELFCLDKLDVHWWPEEQTMDIDGFIFTHGTRVSKHAGYSAKSEMEKWGASGISGHTHRLASFNQSTYGRDMVWYEAGCLCQLNPHYVNGRPNWQQGLAIGDFTDGQATIHQLQIDRRYRILHHGKVFDGS